MNPVLGAFVCGVVFTVGLVLVIYSLKQRNDEPSRVSG